MSSTTTTELIDGFGRRIEYLRMSVTDRCDFRCVYCMSEDVKFLPRDQVLSLEELATIGQAFSELGVKKIRLTGGEPLVRHDIISLAEKLAALPGLDELTMTTNGSQLERYAEPLQRAGIKRLNISLDSLNPLRFAALTRREKLDQVLRGIRVAADAGFERIKLNTVVIKGRNDDEVIDLVDFARELNIDISFIEEMPLGVVSTHNRQESLCTSDDVLKRIQTRHGLVASAEKTAGPSRYYRMQDSDIRVGFISPHSHNFCDSCNRIRLTVEGQLLLCLGRDNSVDLRAVVRRYPGDAERLKQTIIDAMQCKPKEHTFYQEDQPQVVRFMNMTGG
ncbi:GTP 3',8-cyclase MoaA [Neptunomonas antarctica]|uniref:GTP 3',8-cyclase n=1 Tax=Neptunomonas antarctica TaxID=619304 RepID=A0A1N7NST2_9GAMM|nr:GTP 3',8-cyclase MoaA [Neptunomonas antarctica]SIT01338.1 cyclic pyranopterin monophosphate synthase subunit MoaA [Neptunomonas antarctica]